MCAFIYAKMNGWMVLSIINITCDRTISHIAGVKAMKIALTCVCLL